MFKIEQATEIAHEALADLDPARIDGRDAARLAEVAARGEKLLATAKVLLARRAEETRAWARTSHASSAEQWLADASGCSEGAAREALHTARRLDGLPLTADKLRSGELSLAQASHDAYRFDAMVELGEARAATGTNARSHAVRVRVDLPALLRGRTEPGETCEIPGVGPVPVDHAREVLSHGLLQLVIADGVDVQTVVSNTRYVPTPLAIAIAERDQACRVRGCDRDRHLERHHTLEFERSHRTTYTELGNLCPEHHDLVTHKHYETVDNGDGTWDLRPPAHAPPGEAAA